MSDEKSTAPAESAAASAPEKKGIPIKIVGIVAAVMLVEAAGVYVVVSKFSHNPAAASAKELEGGGEHASRQVIVEVPLVADQFQNMSAGKAWLWDVSMHVQVRQVNETLVKDTLKAREATVKEGIAMIFRKASLNQLKEPGLETVIRQVTAFVNKVIESDPDGTSRVERVLISKCRGFPLD